ncbi:MAG: phosphate propanoyltransferase [Patescibacteria group bacterium]
MIKNKKIKIEVSARHVHLTEIDFIKLFGKAKFLTPLRKLSQPGMFAAKETVTLVNKDKKILKVRIVGSFRTKTQVEISLTDAHYLGIKPAIRKSGNIKGSSGITIIGPKGRIYIKEGVIAAQRHIHASPAIARKNKVKNGQIVYVEVKGKRKITFHNVVIRVKPDFNWHMHIDTDEANAAGVDNKNKIGEVIVA